MSKHQGAPATCPLCQHARRFGIWRRAQLILSQYRESRRAVRWIGPRDSRQRPRNPALDCAGGLAFLLALIILSMAGEAM